MNFKKNINKIIYYHNTLVRFGFTKKQIFNRFLYLVTPKKDFLKYRPIWILLYVSDLCNYRCKMCPHHTGSGKTEFKYLKNNTGFMKPEMVEKILTRFPEATHITLAGVGEPLLNPYFDDIVDIVSREKRAINIVTNGSLLNKKMAEKILSSPYINQISISLNAPDPELFSKVCNVGPEKYDLVLSNIENLVKLKNDAKHQVTIIISAVFSEEYLPLADKFLSKAGSIGVDKIDLHNYIDFKIEDKIDSWHKIQNSQRNKKIINKLKAQTKNIKAEVSIPRIYTNSNFNNKCAWFFKNLSFDAQGNMGSCGRVINPNKSYGNINDKDDVWNNKYMRMMRTKFLNNKIENYCIECTENYDD